MKVDVNNVNPAFVEMIKDPSQKIFLDTNIFISPDRSGLQNMTLLLTMRRTGAKYDHSHIWQ